MVGGVAWAVLIVGAFMGFKWLQAGAYQPIVTFYLPGVLLTLVTQVQWANYRAEMARKDIGPEQESQASVESRPPDRPPRPTARRRKRNPRTGRSKS